MNFIPFISIIISYLLTLSRIKHKTCTCFTFIIGKIWNFCLKIFWNWDINARGWQPCIISYDFWIIWIFPLKKSNIVVDLLMIYKLGEKKKGFIISIFHSSIVPKISPPKKKKKKTLKERNRATPYWIVNYSYTIYWIVNASYIFVFFLIGKRFLSKLVWRNPSNSLYIFLLDMNFENPIVVLHILIISSILAKI